jgi:hypothetical protein
MDLLSSVPSSFSNWWTGRRRIVMIFDGEEELSCRQLQSMSSSTLEIKETDEQPCKIEGVENNEVLVLVWTKFHRDPLIPKLVPEKYIFRRNEESAEEGILSCSLTPKCTLTSDRTKLNDSDGIVFHSRDLHFELVRFLIKGDLTKEGVR